ncbi:putative secreted protein (Por secretion system target) [Lutibacter sp. Hel_I_33_5]|uniref:leucine-rich repeat protein n=1 Tax=Lutibacter sp. Hel_I_33_5 TaxID=1566289 RepID=UPI0011A2853B|nr:leucine-rich repeat protein [Lutibacter sp. Hel_I_33_5]TVZ56290.1 putative secreted protein (Por secretion system target) [Lutibacter sp. Hel_I_33_5]
MKAKGILLIAFFISALNIQGQSFKLNGVLYTVTDTSKNHVSIASTSCFTGDLTLQSPFDYDGVTYTITKINDFAFSNCNVLTSIEIPDSVTSIGSYSFYNCTTLATVSLPNSIPKIGVNTFENTIIQEINIPNSVTKIEDSAFSGCKSLANVMIPNSLELIGKYAFYNCENLTKINIPESVTSLDVGAFSGTGLTEFTFTNTITTVASSLFQNCKNLTSITIPDYITEIPFYFLRGCTNLTEVNLHETITKIGSGAFRDCVNLESMVLPESITSLSGDLFKNCTKLKQVNIPANVGFISSGMFENCTSLENITLPENTLRINNEAFSGCSKLKKINIPERVNIIERMAFQNCESLSAVIVNWQTPLTINANVFENITLSNVTLKVPDNTKTTYEAAEVWKTFGTITNDPIIETTKIPDANFEQYLIDANIDSDQTLNGRVPTSDIENISELSPIAKGISDLTGIQDFKSLKSLKVDSNNITKIDVTKNTLLESLDISKNKIVSIDVSNLLKLKSFISFDNLITNINFSENKDLETISLSRNSIKTIDVSSNENLTSLLIQKNNLTELDLLKNKKLKNLTINFNQINTIDLTNNLELDYFELSENVFKTLDVSKNIKLRILNLDKNQLTNIDLSTNENLYSFYADDNSLEYLNLSNNPKLEIVNANNNSLIGLNIKNGNNSIIREFEAKGNSSLTCIQVDDSNAWNNRSGVLIDTHTSFKETCPTYTKIPDANFEAYLEARNLGNGIANDGLVETEKINTRTYLDISGQSISDITGIEDFTELNHLEARNNTITQVDLSKNLKLERLVLKNNQLTSIDVSKNINLKTILDVSNNQLQELDVSLLTELKDLICSENQISELNLTNNKELLIVSAFENKIKKINVDENKKLYSFNLINNQLESVSIKNSNNQNLSSSRFKVSGNPNLHCVQVDDVDYSNTNWTNKDAQTRFYTNCTSLTAIPDTNFEAYLEQQNLGNGIENDGFVLTEAISSLSILNLSHKNIASLSGIQDFINLKTLSAYNNSLVQVDLSKNTKLDNINFGRNQLSSIDLSNNLSLTQVNLGSNNLTSIEVHQLKNLWSLRCQSNQLEALNLYSNKNLRTLYCNDNQLKNLDLRENAFLGTFWGNDNLLESLNLQSQSTISTDNFNIKNNPNLTCIEVDNVNYSQTTWTNKDAAASFSTDCAPANDDCVNAIPLTFNQQTPGDINSGTINNNPTCASGNVIADVWYTVVVPQSGEFSIQGTAVGGNLKFAIYQTCSSSTAIACGDNISLSNLTVAAKFYLKVWLEGSSGSRTSSQSENGTFTIKAKETATLSTDNFITGNKEIAVYPNPSINKEFTVLLKNDFIKTIEIYSLNGKKLLLKNADQQKEIKINTSKLAAGIYYVKVNGEERSYLKKVMIK